MCCQQDTCTKLRITMQAAYLKREVRKIAASCSCSEQIIAQTKKWMKKRLQTWVKEWIRAHEQQTACATESREQVKNHLYLSCNMARGDLVNVHISSLLCGIPFLMVTSSHSLLSLAPIAALAVAQMVIPPGGSRYFAYFPLSVTVSLVTVFELVTHTHHQVPTGDLWQLTHPARLRARRYSPHDYHASKTLPRCLHLKIWM